MHLFVSNFVHLRSNSFFPEPTQCLPSDNKKMTPTILRFKSTQKAEHKFLSNTTWKVKKRR